MDDYIEGMKTIQTSITDFIEDDCNFEFSLDSNLLFNILKIHEDKANLKSILHIINKTSKYYHHSPIFFTKIELILAYFSDQIKQNLSNEEIFHIFKKNKRVLLYLFEKNLLIIDKDIADSLMKYKYYKEYFFPELMPYFEKDKYNEEDVESIKIQRKNTDNENYIYKLIQNDLVEDFIAYVNRTNLSLQKTKIDNSYLETNKFLMENSPSLIEYAAFFGSIQIFQYLRLNGVEMKPSLWLYSIHGKCPEIIHLIEEDHIKPPKNSFEECYLEAIKCFHNSIADYILENYMPINYEMKSNECIKKVYKSHNFFYLDQNYDLWYLCKYNYLKIVEILLESKMFKIEDFIKKV